MGRVRVKDSLAPSYMAAAERMLERLGLGLGEVSSPQELREHLIRQVKNPSVSEFNEFTIVWDVMDAGKKEAPEKKARFVFHEFGEIMAISPKGQHSFLFIGTDGAGFVQYETPPSEKGFNPDFIFYSDPNGKIEREGRDARFIAEGEIKGTVLSALAALERVAEFRRTAAFGIIFTGAALK